VPSLEGFDEWLRDDGLDPKTVEAYVGQVRRWQESGDDLLVWARAKVRDAPAGSISQIRTALRKWVGYSEGEAAAAALRLPRSRAIPAAPRTILTIERIRSLIERFRHSKKLKPRTKVILILQLFTGLRIFELCALRASQIVSRNKVRGLEFVGKHSRRRFVPLSTSAQAVLDKYIEQTDPAPGAPLFPGQREGTSISEERIRQELQGFRHADEPELTTHLLRHSFASASYRDGVDLNTLRVLLGHSDLSTTTIYAQPDDALLATAVNALADYFADPSKRPKRAKKKAKKTRKKR